MASERFFIHVNVTDDCQLWTGPVNNGYGRYWVCRDYNGRNVLRYAHVYAWERANGPVPEGKEVCHHCDTPLCVRLDHLFLGTRLDNMRDAKAKGRICNGNKRKRVCKYGHKFTPANTWVRANGQRQCRVCKRRRKRESQKAVG